MLRKQVLARCYSLVSLNASCPRPKYYAVVYWVDHKSEHQRIQNTSFVFPSATRYTPCLKNYALQTRIPNREKDLSLELEIALVISSILKRVTRENRPVFCWKHGNPKMYWHAPPWVKILYSKGNLQHNYASIILLYVGRLKSSVLNHPTVSTKM